MAEELSPSKLSSGPKRQVIPVSIGPQTISSVIVQQNTRRVHPHLSVESTSPPITSTKTPSGTHLPYPRGDYASPSNSPPGSKMNVSVRIRPIPIPELPNTGRHHFFLTSSSADSMSYFGGHDSIRPTVCKIGNGAGLPPPQFTP